MTRGFETYQASFIVKRPSWHRKKMVFEHSKEELDAGQIKLEDEVRQMQNHFDVRVQQLEGRIHHARERKRIGEWIESSNLRKINLINLNPLKNSEFTYIKRHFKILFAIYKAASEVGRVTCRSDVSIRNDVKSQLFP